MDRNVFYLIIFALYQSYISGFHSRGRKYHLRIFPLRFLIYHISDSCKAINQSINQN